jgi:hypothetical protein
MHQLCPHCDQPDLCLLRLVLIGEILCTDEQIGAATPGFSYGVKAPAYVCRRST